MRGWTSSSKNTERPPDNNKTKEENRREKSKRKKERAALEWDDIDMQAELKSFIYIDRSLRNKDDGLINKLNFKKCMHLKISMKSKFFIGITNKQRKYIINPDFMFGNE